MTDPYAQLRESLVSTYRIEREIGAGGMATVLLATDLKHHRPVAIKVLRAELAQSLGPERFLREIEIAAKLQHPNIAERGALHQQLGEKEKAIEFYEKFIAAWRSADPKLQPEVERAKQAVLAVKTGGRPVTPAR